MRVPAILLAAALVLTPLGARAADLVVWWEEGFNSGEDAAVREISAAFEQKTGRKVDLSIYSREKLLSKILPAIEAGQPPDLVYAPVIEDHMGQWAHEGRLVDLTDALGPMTAQFDREALDAITLLDATTGQRGLYGLPMARDVLHLHLWKSLLERTGFTLADIPKEWESFWSFWCDQVQPAVRKATERDDIYGVALDMSALPGGDTDRVFWQFAKAYEADYVTRDGRLIIDEPVVRAKLVKVLESLAAIHHKGCNPPDAVDWDNQGNNKAFLEQRVVVTMNNSLSIPNVLRTVRPEDYYKNAATIEWPHGAYGQPLVIIALVNVAVVFGAGGHTATAKEFVRFLVGEGWLVHWLDFVGDRYLPPLPALLEQPFWLNPGDPHHMIAAMQLLTRPHGYGYTAASGEWRHRRVITDGVWPRAVHRVAAEGVSPERAADEAIARVKQILSE
jgi:multiple sugar transport system substrate-binding protein